MKKGIYNSLIPVLLTLLINHRDKYDNFNFTVLHFANLIKMINDNYLPMSKNIEYTNDKLQISKNMLIEYFKRIDNLISYYITHGMNLLHEAGIANWQEFTMLCIVKADTHLKLKQSGNSITPQYKLDAQVTTSFRLASQEEIQMIFNIKKKVQDDLCIENSSDCYFGERAKDYMTKVREELLKHDILFDFKMYQLQFLNKSSSLCKLLLSTYDKMSEVDRIDCLNEAFKQLITELAEKRYNKDVEKYSNKYSDNYIDFYKLLIGITVDNECVTYDDLPKTQNGVINYDLVDIYLNNQNIKSLGE